jgi:hypothetical protein
MVAILKVLDKGEPAGKGKKASPAKVLERHSVDANEIVASDPERFSIVDPRLPTTKTFRATRSRRPRSLPSM